MSAVENLVALFAFPFVQRALVAGILVSLCASMLGVVLVLKHYSLIGHGLADIGFASLSFAAALGLPPLLVSTPVVIVASFGVMAVSQRKGVAGDVALGVAASGALALGVMITALSGGFSIDVYNYMFGSILAMSRMDVAMSALLAVVVIAIFAFFFNRLFLVTCDEDFATSIGVDVARYQFLISFLTALVVVLGMRMMGTLLISSLIIFPAVTARRLVSSFRALVAVSGAISALCFAVGMCASLALDLPTGASVVAVNIAAMVLSRLKK